MVAWYAVVCTYMTYIYDVERLEQVEVVVREPDLDLLQLDLVLVLIELVLTCLNHLRQKKKYDSQEQFTVINLHYNLEPSNSSIYS